MLASGRAIANAVGSALITDIVPNHDFGKAISIASSIILFSAIIGFSITGLAAQKFGLITTLLFAALISFIAIFFLIPINVVTQEVKYDEN